VGERIPEEESMAPSRSRTQLPEIMPPSLAATSRLTRRNFLRGAGLGAGALTLPSLLAACGGGSGGGSSSGTLTVGANEAVGSGRAFDQMKARLTAFDKQASGLTLKTKYVDHNTFQEGINNYLQGNPDDVFTWFAGYRVRSFADNGLVGDVSDVWPIDGVNDAFKKASTGSDGKQYFVPTNNYPWAVFYFKSLWEKNGYEVPKTLDELVTLSKKMKADGLEPIAFADKDGWPAMGTFDILNMRINGYDYHIKLMAGDESWESDQVKTVFDTWRGILPYHQADALGRTFQESVSSLQQKKTGMYFLGLFLTDTLPVEQQQDIDFFTFPEVDTNIGADAIDAPIDGFCMSANPKNEKGAKDLLRFLGSAKANDVLNTQKIPQISTNANAQTSNYTDLQKRAADFIGQQKSIAQFLDRDTDPAFASTVMIPALQQFLKQPDDIDGLVKSIEQQRKSIFAG
jgi:multiple sugar transport system substrate-binding protein